MDIEKKNALLKAKGSVFFNEKPVDIKRDISVQDNELVKQVFKVNPETGLPDNDLSIMNDQKTSLTLRQAIKNVNKVITPNAPSSFDEDALLDGQKQPYESDDDYFDRIRQDIEDMKSKE